MLRSLLIGPLVAAAIGTGPFAAWPSPFGAPRWATRLAVGLLLLGIAARAWHRAPLPVGRVVAVAGRLAGVVAVALVAHAVVRARATGFYTADVLVDALTAMLALHGLGLVGDALAPSPPAASGDADGPDFAAEAVRRRARWQLPGAMPADIPAALDAGAAFLVVAFWMLAALAARELAGVLLIVAGGLVLASVAARFARAWLHVAPRARRRARRHLALRRRRVPPDAP